jgi:hypothetical protein
MVKFLKTTGITNEIEQLITNSKQQLYLITPYLQISPILKPLIRDLVLKIPTISIMVVCRSDKINAEDMEFFQGLKIVKILALDNLHAKCYINEETAVISSMNLYQYSEGNNYEMGIKIDKKDDEKIFNQIFDYISIIMRESKKYEIKKIDDETPVQKKSYGTSKVVVKPTSQQIPNNGFCIHCGTEIALNDKKPFCLKCSHLANYSNPSSPEKYCHVCGKESKQSFGKPTCLPCYRKLHK